MRGLGDRRKYPYAITESEAEWRGMVEHRLTRLEYLLIAIVFGLYTSPWVTHAIGAAFGAP